MRFPMLKRDVLLFLRCIVPAVVLTAVFAAVCAMAAFAALRGSEDVYTPVKAAVVDGEGTVLSRMLIKGVAKTDYISELMEISSCDMEEAMEGLRSGAFAAVIVLPENMVDDILTGEKAVGTIYLSASAASHSDIVAGAARFGELMLAAGQNGIFAGERLIWQNGLGVDFHSKYLELVNTSLLGEAMGAGTVYFEQVITEYGDTSMSTTAYYAMNWLCFLLLLSVMFFHRLYSADMNRSMLCRLRSAGVKDARFVSGKLLTVFLFQLLLLFAAVAGLKNITEINLNLTSALCLVLCGALLSCMGAGLMMGTSSGSALTALLAVAGLLLCGGIVPRQILPELLPKIGAVTPFGAVCGILAPVFGGKAEMLPLAAGAVYIAAALAAVKLRIKRLRVRGESE